MENAAYWQQGEKSRVAEAAGIPLSRLCDYLAGARGISARRARELEAASTNALGESRGIPAAAWLRLENHPAFGLGKK